MTPQRLSPQGLEFDEPEPQLSSLMCGRVIQSSGPLRLAVVEGLNITDSRMGNIRLRYNAAPSQELLVIRENHKTGERSLAAVAVVEVIHSALDFRRSWLIDYTAFCESALRRVNRCKKSAEIGIPSRTA